MSEGQDSSSKGSKSAWSHEENINLILTVWHQQDPSMTVKGWDKITEELQKSHPSKGISAFKHQLKKLRDPFITALGGPLPKPVEGGANGGKPKTSRKRMAPTADADNTRDRDVKHHGRVAKRAKAGSTKAEVAGVMVDHIEGVDRDSKSNVTSNSKQAVKPHDEHIKAEPEMETQNEAGNPFTKESATTVISGYGNTDTFFDEV